MLYYTFMTPSWFIAAVCVSSIWQGAFWGLMVGLVVGVIRMALEFSYQAPSCGQKNLQPAIVADVHYLYFAIILFTVTSVTIIVVSLATAPISEQNVSMKHSFIHSQQQLTSFSRSQILRPSVKQRPLLADYKRRSFKIKAVFQTFGTFASVAYKWWTNLRNLQKITS